MQAKLDKMAMEKVGVYDFFLNLESGQARGEFLILFSNRAMNSYKAIVDMSEREKKQFRKSLLESYKKIR
jgi:hypothetical protein